MSSFIEHYKEKREKVGTGVSERAIEIYKGENLATVDFFGHGTKVEAKITIDGRRGGGILFFGENR